MVRPPLHNSSSPRDKEPTEADALHKWQQQRIERRLRGEYESAVLHLSQVINSNLGTPVSISAVRVEGAPSTRRSFLASLIDPSLATPTEHPSTLQDVLQTTRRISHGLTKTDIFSSVEAYIDSPRDPKAAPTDVDLVFRTKERGKWYVKTATELGNQEGSASASARVRNVFGGAETFEANITSGTKTRRSFRGTFVSPLTSSMNTFGELSAYGIERDLTSYASCWEGLRGARASIRNGSPQSSTGSNEVAYEAIIRHIRDLSPTASMSTRTSAGVTVKSSLSHTWLYDTRDDKMAATRGLYAKFFQELAGGGAPLAGSLGGDAHFYKVEAESQLSRRIATTGVSVSLSARTGLLWALDKDSKSTDDRPTTHFSDRFQLGGPTSIRGFRSNGLGPKDGSNSTGGEIYYSAGASVISDIPTKAHWPVKTHAWVNAGRLDEVDQSRPLKETLLSTLTRPSISAGVGLIYRFDPIRVEVNFAVPIVASKSDGRSRGVQVGMGVEFL